MTQDVEFLVNSIRCLDRYFQRAVQKKAEQSGITLPQMRVIKEVIKHQGISIKELSQNLDMTQSTVSDVVERLIAKNLLMKKTNSRDKRFVEIWSTQEVTRFLESGRPDFLRDALRNVTETLSPEDLSSIIQAVRKLLSAVERTSEGELLS